MPRPPSLSAPPTSLDPSLCRVSCSSDRRRRGRPDVGLAPHPAPHLLHEEEGRGELRAREETHLQESPHHRDLRIDPSHHHLLPTSHQPRQKLTPICASSLLVLLRGDHTELEKKPRPHADSSHPLIFKQWFQVSQSVALQGSRSNKRTLPAETSSPRMTAPPPEDATPSPIAALMLL